MCSVHRIIWCGRRLEKVVAEVVTEVVTDVVTEAVMEVVTELQRARGTENKSSTKISKRMKRGKNYGMGKFTRLVRRLVSSI